MTPPVPTPTAEELALELLEALKEQVAECFCEDCEMCARHEEIIRRTNAHLKGEADADA